MYKNVIPIEQTLTRGRWQPEFGEINQAILGQGVAHSLGVNVHIYYPLKVYVPKNGPVSPFLPIESVKGEKLFPVGVFSLDAQSDGEYVIVPLRFAQTLVGEKKVSAIAVKLVAGADPNQVKHNLQQLLGDDFVIKTHSEQKQSVYRIMQYEKWGIYTILLLVMVIGAFGIVGALVMLIMEKHRDIETLTAMGLTRDKLKMIFINEGLLIALIGGLIGGVFGGALCWGQARWGWVKLQGQSFLIDYYPVDVHFVDVLLVYLSVVVVAWLMSLITVSVTLRSYKK
jgi:lipoprotein-releasing system permease protein